MVKARRRRTEDLTHFLAGFQLVASLVELEAELLIKRLCILGGKEKESGVRLQIAGELKHFSADTVPLVSFGDRQVSNKTTVTLVGQSPQEPNQFAVLSGSDDQAGSRNHPCELIGVVHGSSFTQARILEDFNEFLQ